MAFLYKWTEKSTGKWYVGSRTAIGCHPDDGYICSSKIVRPKIIENPSNWERSILCLGESTYILDLELKFLRTYRVRRDPTSYNSCTSKPPKHNKPHSAEAKAKIKARRALQVHDESFVETMRLANKKRWETWPEEKKIAFKQKMSEVSLKREAQKRKRLHD